MSIYKIYQVDDLFTLVVLCPDQYRGTFPRLLTTA